MSIRTPTSWEQSLAQRRFDHQGGLEAESGHITWITGFTKINEDYYGSLGFCNPIDCPGGFLA